MTSTTQSEALKAHISERVDDDWYVEPVWASRALFNAETFEGGIWDPACGGGNILLAAQECGIDAGGTDITNRSVGRGSSCRDFFRCGKLSAPNIVMNPPFGGAKLAEKFIRHAILLRPEKLAIFVDSRFLFGKARAAGLFAEFPPTRIWLIMPRPSCPPGDYLAAGQKAGGGTADYCWIVWTPGSLYGVDTRFGWLRCAP